MAFACEILLVVAAIAISETWFNPATYLLAIVVIGTRINGIGGLIRQGKDDRNPPRTRVSMHAPAAAN